MEASELWSDWKSFRFHLIQPDHYSEVYHHLESNFYYDEPMNQLLGPTSRKSKDINVTVTHFLDHKLSICARDKETNKIAGVLIMGPHHKNENSSEFHLSCFEAAGPTRACFILSQLERRVNIFKKYNVNTYIDLFILSVDRHYRNQGLGNELHKRALCLLKSTTNYTVAKSIFTNPYSHKIAMKFHYQELCRENFTNFKDENGSPLVPGAEPHQYAVLMSIQI